MIPLETGLQYTHTHLGTRFVPRGLVFSWSYKIDLARYSCALVYDPSKTAGMLQCLRSSDYRLLGLSGQSLDELAKLPDARQKIVWIQTRLWSYPKFRRSLSLESFMAVTLPDHILHMPQHLRWQSKLT